MKRLNRIIFVITLFLLSAPSFAQDLTKEEYEQDKKDISAMMTQQSKDWTAGRLEAFMEGYLKSDKLYFVGSSGLTSGWAATLANYKKGYPTPEHTGKLSFNLVKFEPLAKGIYLVIGQFKLERKVGDAQGWFSIVLKKIDGAWKIIADHSS